jgi:hypothetical protein
MIKNKFPAFLPEIRVKSKKRVMQEINLRNLLRRWIHGSGKTDSKPGICKKYIRGFPARKAYAF